MLGNTPNQPNEFRTKNWAEINNEEGGTYHTNSQIKFKTSILRSSLCDYSYAYTLKSGTITVAGLQGNNGGNNGIEIVFENWTSFINCISEINNTQIDNVKYIDLVMPMYNLIEYSDNYSKSESLWQYCRDEQIFNDTGVPVNFSGHSALFQFKQKRKDSTGDEGKW